jgi:iron(III) transport system substrate-binding protein
MQTKIYSVKVPALLKTGMLLGIMLIAGCSQVPGENITPTSPAPSSSAADQPADSTSSAEQQLIDEAKKEGGQLMFYTSLNIDDLELILNKFEEAYPFTSTDYYRASGSDVIQKALLEKQAGKQFADVFETESFEIYRLQEAGLLQPYIAPERDVYPEDAKDPEGFWTVDRINTVVIGYNTDLVAPADAPKTWDDLLDPKWKGKIGVEVNDVELLAGMVKAWGEQKAFSFWEGIAAQEPGIIDGHTELAELVSAGEFAVSPNLYGHRVEKLKKDGAPIDWVRTDPVIAFTQLLAMAADAPHPATARLFINWLLSEEGQNTYRELGRIPNRPGVEVDPPGLVEGLNLLYTVPGWAADYASYAEKWNSLFHLK